MSEFGVPLGEPSEAKAQVFPMGGMAVALPFVPPRPAWRGSDASKGDAASTPDKRTVSKLLKFSG